MRVAERGTAAHDRVGGGRRIDLTARDRRRALMAAGLLLAAVIALDAWLHLVGPLPGEGPIGRWAMDWHPRHLSPDFASALSFFNTLATPYIAAATVLAAALTVTEKDGRRWGLIVVAASGVVVLNAVLKHVLGPTPLWVELRDAGRNYPSGHVAYATALFGCLALVTWRHRQRTATIALAAIIPLMAVDRVVMGAHLPSDVIAGFLVGGAWLIGVLALAAPDDALRPVAATGNKASRPVYRS